jgi:hypothetical protein
MDDNQPFMELSALLTGLYDPLLNDPEDARRLAGTFPQEFPALLAAYKALTSVDPKPPIDDVLLAKLRATQTFKDNEIVAKQIVNVWYFSQFNDKSGAHHIDGGFYERGAVWPVIKAHPLGFSTQLHGYWARVPTAH